VQEGKLARTSFPLQWNNIVRDVLVLMQDGKLAQHALAFPHGGMMFEMYFFFCKMKS
jgi:hypothetical protein